MTRIISGPAGGTVLDVPGRGTRPTSDRVRESLFGALESADAVVAARVADLYAGSGALGLEAISRGAATADLVENAGAAAAIARRNAIRVDRAMGGGTHIRVLRASVATFLAGSHGPYDLVLADPPYDLGERDLAEIVAAIGTVVTSGGLVVVERSSRSPEPAVPPGLAVERHRRYGDTAVWWLRAEERQPRAESQSR